MITSASIGASGVSPQPLATPSVPRGNPSYPIDCWDLIAFSQSERRWRYDTARTPTDTTTYGEMLRALAAGSLDVINSYAHRPADYVHTRNECPSCKSVSPAKVCRTCGLGRVSISEVREWNGGSKFCSAWAAEQLKHNLRIVNDEVWTRATAAFANLTADPAIMELASGSTSQQLLSAIWHDTATGLDIPLRTVISCVPSMFGLYADCLATLEVAYDSSPLAWNDYHIEHGLHVAAAFRQMIHNATTGESRSTHCWVIAERKFPHLIARRASSPDLLAAGTALVHSILADYAQSLATDTWSSYDSDSMDPLTAFSPIPFEPWMANAPASVRPLCLPFTPEIVEA